MLKMVLIFGIVFFVSCTLPLAQGQSSGDEEWKNILQRYVNPAVSHEGSESGEMRYGPVIKPEEIPDLSKYQGKVPFEVIESLLG